MFLLLLIFLLIFVSFSKFYLKKDIIKIFGHSALIVVTGSMEPTIHIKELIVIKEMEDYNVRDIVTYKDKENNFVTHRIVDIENNKIITRGDNNTINDEPIDKINIEGKVIYHSIVLGEFFLRWLKPMISFIILILIFNYIKGCVLIRKENENGKESN